MVERYSKAVARRSLGNLPKVTPKDQRINTAEASAWGQLAQTGAALSSQFAQYAREDAKYKAIIDAEGVAFERDAHGMTVMPPPVTQGGSIYQKNYTAVVNNMYKRSIKTDIETKAGEIFATEFYNPDVMTGLLDNSINSIIANTAPHMQQELNLVAQNIKNSYVERSVKAKTHRVYNANIESLNNEYPDLVNKRLIARDVQSILSADEDLSNNIQERYKLEIITKKQAELEMEGVQHYINYDKIKSLINIRVGEDAQLLNSVDAISRLSEMFKGMDETTVELLGEDKKIHVYTKEIIEQLIPDMNLRHKMGVALEQRANKLGANQTLDAFDLAYQTQLEYMVNSNNQGKEPTLTSSQYDKIMTKILDDNVDLGIFVSGLGKNPAADAVEMMRIAGFVGRFDAVPNSLKGMVENISTASAKDVANWHLPFYHTISRNPILKDIWDKSNIDSRVKGIFDGLSTVVGLSDDPVENARIYNEILPKIKIAYQEEQVDLLSALIEGDKDKDYQGVKRTNFIKTNTLGYVTSVLNAHSVINPLKITKEHKLQVLTEVQKYLEGRKSGGGKDITIDGLDELIVNVGESITKTILDDPNYIGRGWSQKDNLSVFNFDDHENLTEFNSTEQNKEILDVANNLGKYGGRIEDAYVNYAVAKYLSNVGPEYNLSAYLNSDNTRSGKELRLENNNRGFGKIDPESKISELNLQSIKFNESDHANFSVPYEETIDGKVVQKNAIMVLGKTFRLGRADNGMANIVLINDGNGQTTEITGLFADGNGVVLEIDLQSLLTGKQRETESYKKFRAKEEYGKTIINDAKKTASNLSDGSPPELDEDGNAVKNKWEKEADLLLIQNLKEQEEMLKNMLEDGSFNETDPEHRLLKNISFLNKIPLGDPLITAKIVSKYEGVGAATVHDSAELVSAALPAGNQINVKRKLMETAWVESYFGMYKENDNAITYKKEGEYGIWQNVTEMNHIVQQLSDPNRAGMLHKNAATLEEMINTVIVDVDGNPLLNFRFATMTREDLAIPLISASVARLAFANKDDKPESASVENRGKSWAKFYNTDKGASKGSSEIYLTRLKAKKNKGDDQPWFIKEMEKLTKERMLQMYLPKKEGEDI